jgi:hypothetical protein
MWGVDDIAVKIGLVDHPVMIVRITVPVGTLEVIGSVSKMGAPSASTEPMSKVSLPGRSDGAGLNAIGRKLLEEADVDEIVIQGGARTTGRNKGARPRPIRYPGR